MSDVLNSRFVLSFACSVDVETLSETESVFGTEESVCVRGRCSEGERLSGICECVRCSVILTMKFDEDETMFCDNRIVLAVSRFRFRIYQVERQ